MVQKSQPFENFEFWGLNFMSFSFFLEFFPWFLVFSAAGVKNKKPAISNPQPKIQQRKFMISLIVMFRPFLQNQVTGNEVVVVPAEVWGGSAGHALSWTAPPTRSALCVPSPERSHHPLEGEGAWSVTPPTLRKWMRGCWTHLHRHINTTILEEGGGPEPQPPGTYSHHFTLNF